MNKSECIEFYFIFPVYVIELALKLSPLPLSVQRKELKDAESLYQQIRQCLEKGHLHST